MFLFHNACGIVQDASEVDAAGKPKMTWMLVDDKGKVAEMGPKDEEEAAKAKATHATDVGHRLVIPGLHDAHLHVRLYGQHLRSLDLSAAGDVETLQSKLREYAAENRESPFIECNGFSDQQLGRMPTRDDVDAVVSDRPAVLWRCCIHVACLNSKALELLGITADSPDPEGCQIDRREGSKEPNGVLREMFSTISRMLDGLRAADVVYNDVSAGLASCVGMGVTAVQCNDAGSWAVYKRLVDEEKLRIRVFLTIPYDEMGAPGSPAAGETHGALLSCARVKLFGDGSLGAETAALSQPYNVAAHQRCVHGKDHSGMLTMTADDLNKKVSDAVKKGFAVEFHAIGDSAAEQGLLAYEAAGVGPDNRCMLTHCQILRKGLIDRMARRGIIANVQPQFVPSDAAWAAERLPEDLLAYSYVWKTLLTSGVPVSGGSDAPVEPPNPLYGMQTAIFHSKSHGDPTQSWKPEQALSVTEALALYTSSAAHATNREAVLGKLKPGYWADFVVLEAKEGVPAHSAQEEFFRKESWLTLYKPHSSYVAGR
eukprot:gene22647-34661_t